MPAARLAPLWSMLRPVPLSPFLPAYTAENGIAGLASMAEA